MSKCCPPTTVSYEERDENHREPSPGWWWVIKHFPSKTLQEPLRYNCCMRPSMSWRRTIPEDNIARRLFLTKESNYSAHSTFDERLYWLGMFTGSLRAQNWQVRYVAIDWYTRDIAQHICTRLHPILTVVLISRPIGHEKNSLRKIAKIYKFSKLTKIWILLHHCDSFIVF